jgi:hypothetical protein
MPAPTVSLTEEQTLVALRSFLLAVLPEGTPVVAGQDNRVPEPEAANFVSMTFMFAERIETNTDTYKDCYPSAGGTLSIRNPAITTVQLDVHGPASGDNTQAIVTLFRSDWGCQQFAASGFDVTPLHTGEPPHQIPYTNAESQIEERWLIDVVMQVNPTVTIGQDFAASLKVGLIDVGVVYPPH